jgi:hypothetical protein
MKPLNIKYYKCFLILFFVCLQTPSFCQTKSEIEDKVTTILMKIAGKFSYENENEYGEAQKVTGYRWATEIKNGNLIIAASVEKVVRPLNTTDFSSHQSYDVICYFPLQYYERTFKIENGFKIWSNESSSCKRIKKNIVYVDNGNTFKAKDEVSYFKGFDFDFGKEGGELSDEDILLLDGLFKKLQGNAGLKAETITANSNLAETVNFIDGKIKCCRTSEGSIPNCDNSIRNNFNVDEIIIPGPKGVARLESKYMYFNSTAYMTFNEDDVPNRCGQIVYLPVNSIWGDNSLHKAAVKLIFTDPATADQVVKALIKLKELLRDN